MTQIIQTKDYPFVERVLTDNDGQIRQVVLQSLEEARRALEEDES